MAKNTEIKPFDFANWDNINHLPAERFRISITLDANEIMRLSADSRRHFTKWDVLSTDSSNERQEQYLFNGIIIGYQNIKNDTNDIDSLLIHALHRKDNLTSGVGGSFEEIIPMWLTATKDGILQFKDDIGQHGSEPARPFKTINGDKSPIVANISFYMIDVSEWCYALSRSRRTIPILDQQLYQNEYNTVVWEIDNINHHPAFTPAKLTLIICLFGSSVFARLITTLDYMAYVSFLLGALGCFSLAFLALRWTLSQIMINRLDQKLQKLTLD